METKSIKQTGMKYSYLFFPTLLFLIIGLYGAIFYEPVKEITPQSPQLTISDIQDSISALQKNVAALQDSVKNMLAKNPNLDLQMHVNNLEDELKITREDVRHSINDYNDKMSNYLSYLFILLIAICLLFAIFCYVVPFSENKKLEEKIEETRDGLQNVIFEKNKIETTANEAKAYLLFIEALKEEDSDKAIELYNQCIELNPNLSEAYKNIGILNFKKKRLGKALEYINKAIEKDDKLFEAYYFRGLLQYVIKGSSAAINEIQYAININPNYAEAYYIKALLEIELKHYPIANSDFEKAIALKNNVIESLPIRDQLTDRMREIDEQIIENNYMIPKQYTE